MNVIIGSYFERIHETGSTNNYAAKLLLTKRPPEGTIVVADSQVDGRGQASSTWESEPNRNLTFSILLYPDFIEISRQFEISKAISLGVTDFLKDKVDNVSIKWPNDIYIGRKKIAGILIENSVRSAQIASCIVGIGLNINQQVFTGNLPNPVSLSQITGENYNLEVTLKDLCSKIDARYRQLIHGQFALIDANYTKKLFQLGIWSHYTDENGEYEGQILGIDQTGQLLIETRSGETNKYQFKEVVFI